MKTKEPILEEDRDADVITDSTMDHPVGVGLGIVGGALAGATVGIPAGPVGSAIGAVVGGVVGAAAGNATAATISPTEEDLYWSENHPSQQWADPDYTYDDYRPAYRMGSQGPDRYNTSFESAENAMQSDWEETKGDSRLDWTRAREAARAAWHRVERRLPGDADGDGR